MYIYIYLFIFIHTLHIEKVGFTCCPLLAFGTSHLVLRGLSQHRFAVFTGAKGGLFASQARGFRGTFVLKVDLP